LFGIPFSAIPPEARLCVTLYLRYSPSRHTASSAVFRGQKIRKSRSIPVAWANLNLFDSMGFFRTGVCETRMWDGGPAAYFRTASQPSDRKAISVSLEFFKPQHPIVLQPRTAALSVFNVQSEESHPSFSGHQKTADDYPLKKILLADPLYTLNSTEKKLMWKFRHFTCQHDPIALPKLLLAADWTDRSHVEQVHELLLSSPLLPPLSALQLQQLPMAKRIRHPASRGISRSFKLAEVYFGSRFAQSEQPGMVQLGGLPFTWLSFKEMSIAWRFSCFGEHLSASQIEREICRFTKQCTGSTKSLIPCWHAELIPISSILMETAV
jgi:hypothetical protein